MDVPPEVNARVIEGVRRMTPAQRAEQLDAMVRDSRALMELGIRRREPGLTDGQVRWRLCALLYGEPYTERVLGPFPA